MPLLKQPVQDVFLDLLFCRKPLLTSTVDCTWEAAVTQLVLGADSAPDNTSLQFWSFEAVKLWNRWSTVVMCKGLLVSMARNWHDMSIGDASIGPQGYGRSSNAVVCVHIRQTDRFADFLHHVCESVYAKWHLFEPHIIFGTEVCLWVLEKWTAIRVNLFKVEL